MSEQASQETLTPSVWAKERAGELIRLGRELTDEEQAELAFICRALHDLCVDTGFAGGER